MGSSPIYTRPRDTHFASRDLQPPSALFIERGDRLRIRVSGTDTSAIVARARILMPNGEVIPSEWQTTPTNALLQENFDFDLPEGFLLSLTIADATGGGIEYGEAYVQASIIRGGGIAPVEVASLLGGHISRRFPITWPGTPPQHSYNQRGLILSFTGAAPAAGAEISTQVNGNTRWRLIGARLEFTPSATVIPRKPGIIIDDGVNGFYQCRAGVSAFDGPAIVFCVGAHGRHGWAGLNHGFIPIPPDLILNETFRFRTFTSNLQAGDQWGPPHYVVEQWIEA